MAAHAEARLHGTQTKAGKRFEIGDVLVQLVLYLKALLWRASAQTALLMATV